MSSSAEPSRDANSPALIVPLETLVRTDVVLEGAFAEVRHSPVSLLKIAGWRLSGRLALGRKLAGTGAFDPAALPYDESLLQRVRDERARGRRLVLESRAERTLAEAIAAHLGLFDAVIAPSALAEPERSAASRADFAGAEIAQGTPRSGAAIARAAVKALRPHQWTKNALIFVPALLAHAVRNPSVLVLAAIAFVSFSLCASSVYVLNDLLDLHADRAHHRKRNRPFASGALPLGAGLLVAPVLLIASFGLAWWLSSSFAAVLGAYYVATLTYSLYFKRVVLLDVLLLAGLYTVRIIAGGVATGVTVSQWLLAFSMFLFLSLAFVKRYSEVHTMRKQGVEEAKGRGYRASDLELLSSLGAGAGFISVLVLALYINSHEVTRLYAHPERLWGMLPLFLYWVSRVWLLAHRGQMHDDPIVFAIRDRASYAVAALVGVVVWLAV